MSEGQSLGPVRKRTLTVSEASAHAGSWLSRLRTAAAEGLSLGHGHSAQVRLYDESMAREDHTRVGWWVMTHDRAGSALIGSVALAVVIVDASYVATDWHRRGSEFLLGF